MSAAAVSSSPPASSFALVTEEELHGFAASGQKMALFIGRRPNQSLPKEEGILWVSMDPGVDRLGPPEFDRDPSEKRYHLHRAFCPETARKLQNLFEKVVVDRSTYQWFDGTNESNVADLASLLNPRGQGLLIFDPKSKINHTTPEYFAAYCKKQSDELDRFYRIRHNALPGPHPNNLSGYDKLMFGPHLIPDVSWDKRKEKAEMKEMIKTHFAKVEYMAYDSFPYLSEGEAAGFSYPHFIATKRIS